MALWASKLLLLYRRTSENTDNVPSGRVKFSHDNESGDAEARMTWMAIISVSNKVNIIANGFLGFLDEDDV